MVDNRSNEKFVWLLQWYQRLVIFRLFIIMILSICNFILKNIFLTFDWLLTFDISKKYLNKIKFLLHLKIIYYYYIFNLHIFIEYFKKLLWYDFLSESFKLFTISYKFIIEPQFRVVLKMQWFAVAFKFKIINNTVPSTRRAKLHILKIAIFYVFWI